MAESDQHASSVPLSRGAASPGIAATSAATPAGRVTAAQRPGVAALLAPLGGLAAANLVPTIDPATAVPAPGVGVVNLANMLTGLRLLLVPVVGVLLFADGGHSSAWRIAAWVTFAAASATDRVDGAVARRRGLVTSVGKLADPIADKALIGTALVSLSVLGDLTWWVTVVVLVREVGVTLLRFWVIRHGVIPASRGGKLKTALQGLAIGGYVLPLAGALATTRAILLGAAVVVTLVTGADYVLRAIALRRTGSRSVAGGG